MCEKSKKFSKTRIEKSLVISFGMSEKVIEVCKICIIKYE